MNYDLTGMNQHRLNGVINNINTGVGSDFAKQQAIQNAQAQARMQQENDQRIKAAAQAALNKK